MKRIHLWAAAGLLAAIAFSTAIGQSFAGEMENAREEKKAPALAGRVLHTDRWEENRNNANLWYQRHGQSKKIRSADTFWSGEKFILEAEAAGENLPAAVDVSILGTDFETRLYRSGARYRGELFHKEMIFLWGNTEPETLTILFETEIDGTVCRSQQQVIVDNREPYWLLHRKE